MGTRHQFARRGAVAGGALLVIFCQASSAVRAEELGAPARFIRDLQDHLLEQAYRTSYAAGDFNGDGFGDLAIGIPYATVGGERAAGKVIVINGDHHGLTEIRTVYYQGGKGRQRLPHANEAGDLVGFSLAAGDFNGDGIADLAVGAPGQDLPGNEQVTHGIDAGAIFVAHGEAGLGLNFLVPGDMYVQDGGDRPDQFDLAGEMLPGSLLGFSLAAGNFDGDAWTDLAIGLPGKAWLVPGSKTSRKNAGAVVVAAGTAEGLWGRGAAQLFSEREFSARAKDNYNLSGGAHTGDCVGFSLAAGDFNGDGRDDLAIGAPGQNAAVGDVDFKDSGAVKMAKGTPDGLDARAYPVSYGASSQGRMDLAGEAQDFALLGFSLAAGDFDGDGRDDLAVGVPGRHVGLSEYAGAVVVAAGADEGPDGAPGLDGGAYAAEFTQSGADDYDLPGAAHRYALVGFSLAAGDFDFSTLARHSDLAIGAPGVGVMASSVAPEVSAGAVFVRFGSADGGLASAWRQMMLSQTGGAHEDLWDDAEEGDNVGMSVAAASVGAGGAADLMISVPGERFPNLTLGEPLDAPYDQMFVDGMTHVVYGQEGVGLDAGVGQHRWFPRFTRGAQIDPHYVRFDLFPEVMQDTQPIFSDEWTLWYSNVELFLKPWTDPALGTADELYTKTHYVHHGGRELGPRLRDVEGFGVFVIDGTGVLLVVDAYYHDAGIRDIFDFGHRRAVRFLPMFWYLALWSEPVKVILLPNYGVEVIVEP